MGGKLLRWGGAVLVCALVWAVVDSDLGIGLEGAALVGFLFLGGLGVAALLFLAAAIRRSRRLTMLGVACLVVLVGGLAGGDIIADWRTGIVERDAAPIIAAVRAFEQDMGRYPADLGDLVPSQLASVPPARIGLFVREDYLYRPAEDGSSFTLSFDISGGYIRTYNSLKDIWHLHD